MGVKRVNHDRKGKIVLDKSVTQKPQTLLQNLSEPITFGSIN